MAELGSSVRDNTHRGLLSSSSSLVSEAPSPSPSPAAAATLSESSSSSLQSLSAQWMGEQRKQHDEKICQRAKHQCREEKLLRAECQHLHRRMKELDLLKSQLSRHISQFRDANHLGSEEQNPATWWVGMDITCAEQNELDQEVDPAMEEEQHQDLEAISFTESSIENLGGNHADDQSAEYERSDPQDINDKNALDDFKGLQTTSAPTVNKDGRKFESIPLAKFEEELLLLQALSFRERAALQEKLQRLKRHVVQQYVLYQEIEDEEKAFQAVELGQSLSQTVVAKLKIHSLSTDMARLEQLCQDLGAIIVTLYSDHNPSWTSQTGFECSSESTTEPVLMEVQTDFRSELDQFNLEEDRSENFAKQKHGIAMTTIDFSPGGDDQTMIRTHYPETELATEAFMQQHRKRDIISSAAKRLDFESIVNEGIYERNSSSQIFSVPKAACKNVGYTAQIFKTWELNLDKSMKMDSLDLELLDMKDDGAHLADVLCESSRIHDNFEQGDGQESLEIFSPGSDDLFSISSWEKNGGKLSPGPGSNEQNNWQKSVEVNSPPSIDNLFTILSPGKADDTPSQQKSEVNSQGESSDMQVLELCQTTQEVLCGRDGTTVLPQKSEFLHSVPDGSPLQIESVFSEESAHASQNDVEKVLLQGEEQGILQRVCGEELEMQIGSPILLPRGRLQGLQNTPVEGLNCTTVSGIKTMELDHICSKQGEDLRSLNKKLEELAQQLESQIRMREELELRWELQLHKQDDDVPLATSDSTLLSTSLMVQSTKPKGIVTTIEQQHELAFSELSKAKKLQCAAESEAGALNNQVQNLEEVCDNAHKMEVLRIKDEAIWSCMLMLLQLSFLYLNLVVWLHRFMGPWENSFPT